MGKESLGQGKVAKGPWMEPTTRAERDRLRQALGHQTFERIEHRVFSRFLLEEKTVGTPEYWNDVLAAAHEALDASGRPSKRDPNR